MLTARLLLPLLIGLITLWVFVVPSLRVWRLTGRSPITFGRSDSLHDFSGGVFRLTLGLLLVASIVVAAVPSAQAYLGALPWLEAPAISWAGVVLAALGLALTKWAQHVMALAWRIGIDSTHPTQLVVRGPFRFSRNPVFLGLLLLQLGAMLILPNAVTLVCLSLGWVAMNVQARLEEAHLGNQLGEPYADYSRRVRRWL